MGRFIFYFASQAYYDESRNAFPEKGVKAYGDLVHKYNIPVTWLTNGEGAERGKEIFTKFHREFRDEVILYGIPSTKEQNTAYKRDYALKMTQEEIEKYLKSEQKRVKTALPFARVDHIGYFYRTMPAVRAMQKLGIKSCYGHCWEMIATDGVTDNGTPWGFYFIDTEKSWKRPFQTPLKRNRGIVANEWLQHDLNKSWNYYGSCSVFSFDPNDVERAKICDGRAIDYWKAGFREYYRNREWNEFIPFVFHQEAHEQESTPGGWEVYDQPTVDNTYAMTDEFLHFISSGEFPDMTIMTLVQATEKYRESYRYTVPTYMLFKDSPIDMPIWNSRKQQTWATYLEAKNDEEDEGGTLDPVKDYHNFKFLGFPYGWQGMLYEDRTPFPESFVYTDTQVQLFFHRGNPAPIKVWNYLKDISVDPKKLYGDENLFAPNLLPQVSIREEGILIESPDSLPFGIVFWGEYPVEKFSVEVDYSSGGFGDIISVNNIGKDLLFVRLSLDPGLTLLKLNPI